MGSSTMVQSADDLVEKFKRIPFSKGLFPFKASLKDIGTPQAVVYAEEAGRHRWIICDTNTKRPAVFSHAALIAETHDIETGNFVPHGQDAPFGLETKDLQRRANSKCYYTYMFDTHVDISLYEGQWTMDDYMKGMDSLRNLPRRPYLSGQELRYRSKFWMQTPMFLQRGSKDKKVVPPKYLHDWVLRGDQESKFFRANPDRPRVWVKVGGHIVPIADTNPNTLQRGDVAAFSFTVTYHATSSYWFPMFHPADIIVLKRGEAESVGDYSAPALDLYSLPPPSLADLDDVEEGRSQPPENATINVDRSVGVTGGTGNAVAAVGADSAGPAEGKGTREMASSQSGHSDVGLSDADGETDEFEIIERSGIGQGRSSEEFVSAMAIKEDKRRGTGGRATRATRNRD